MSVRIPGRSHNPGVITCGFDVRLDASRPLRRENAIMKRLTIALLLFVSALALPSFTQEKTPKGSDLLRKLEADFAKAVAEHGHDASSHTSPRMESSWKMVAGSKRKTTYGKRVRGRLI